MKNLNSSILIVIAFMQIGCLYTLEPKNKYSHMTLEDMMHELLYRKNIPNAVIYERMNKEQANESDKIRKKHFNHKKNLGKLVKGPFDCTIGDTHLQHLPFMVNKYEEYELKVFYLNRLLFLKTDILSTP